MHARQVGVASRGVAAFGGTTIMTQQRGAQQPQRPQQPQRTQQPEQKRPPQQPPRPQQYARPQQQQQQQHQSPFGITVTATQLRHQQQQQQQQQQHRHHVPSYGNMYRKEVENKTEICIMHPDLNSFSSHSVSTIYIHVYICNY